MLKKVLFKYDYWSNYRICYELSSIDDFIEYLTTKKSSYIISMKNMRAMFDMIYVPIIKKRYY